ncbi:hypothetical protein HYY69_03955 [Candidatus Woesearchaeota archaeon]|nr:hypothetical protein [Candidatus Woesearchaeota archaeon]
MNTKSSFFQNLKSRSKNDIVQAIKTTSWYDQGGQAKFLYMCLPAYTAAYTMSKLHKHGFDKIICISMDDDGTFALDTKAMKSLCDEWVERNTAENNFIAVMSSHMQKAIDEFNVFIQKRMEDLSSLSEEELKQLVQDYVLIIDHLWQPYLPIDGFDENWKHVLDELLAEHYHNKLTDDEIGVLLMPEQLSYVQEEELSLLNIANANSQKKKKLLEVHQKLFFWYKNNYSYIEAMDVKHFEERLYHIQYPKKELQDFLDKIEKIKKQKEDIYTHHAIPEIVKKYLRLMITLSKWRDIRKTYNILSNYYLKQLVKEIADRRGIDFKHFENLPYHDFIERAFTIPQQELEALPAEGFTLYQHGFKPFTVYGKQAKQLQALYEGIIDNGIKEVKGLCACKGTVRGIVKIINKIEDFNKMEQGNILVSYNTRPEFVPIMKKAGAIVTDEGGITSHAAVVSRELNVPCIIGTKRGTDLLKDGMRVEVDATNGMVKIIKSK